MRILGHIIAGAFAVSVMVTQALATVPDCEAMAAEVGRRVQLPEGYLPAISRIEAGRQMGDSRRAWPWTLNHAGKGLYFDTRAEALAYLKKATRKGRTNIDVGCMQINHYWHGHVFSSAEEMIEPTRNIEYAAQYLKELYARHGSWVEAVKHYHSPDEARGTRYFKGFEAAQRILNENSTGGPLSTGIPQTPGQALYASAGSFPFGGAPLQSAIAPDGLFAGIDAQGVAAADEIYARLIAALGDDDSVQSFFVWRPDSQLTKRHEVRGVVQHKWNEIEQFRQSFAQE